MRIGRFILLGLSVLSFSACGNGNDDIPIATNNVVGAFQSLNNEIMDTTTELDPEAMALRISNLQAAMVDDVIACTFAGTIDVSGDFTRSDPENATFALEMDYNNCGSRMINGLTGITGTVTGEPPTTTLNYSFGGVPGPTNVVTIVFAPNNSNCTLTLSGIEVTDTTEKDDEGQLVTSCEVTGFLDADCNIDGAPAIVDCNWNQLDCFNFNLLAQDNCTCNGSGCI